MTPDQNEKREIFAAIAMHALISRMPSPPVLETPAAAAARAVELADALVTALEAP